MRARGTGGVTKSTLMNGEETERQRGRVVVSQDAPAGHPPWFCFVFVHSRAGECCLRAARRRDRPGPRVSRQPPAPPAPPRPPTSPPSFYLPPDHDSRPGAFQHNPPRPTTARLPAPFGSRARQRQNPNPNPTFPESRHPSGPSTPREGVSGGRGRVVR